MKRTLVLVLALVALASASCAGGGASGTTCPIGSASRFAMTETAACARVAAR